MKSGIEREGYEVKGRLNENWKGNKLQILTRVSSERKFRKIFRDISRKFILRKKNSAETVPAAIDCAKKLVKFSALRTQH